MNILITGDSHTAALKLGLDQLTLAGKIPARHSITVKPIGGGPLLVTDFFQDKGDYVAIPNRNELRQITRVPIAEQTIDWYGFCGPLNAIRLWRNKDWQHYTPLLQEASHKQLISQAVLRKLVLQDVQQSLCFLEILQRIGVKVFVVEAPRPYRHHWINDILAKELVFYLDNFYRQFVKNWLNLHQIPVIALPDYCYDVGGFMDEKFRNKKPTDQHHANQDFGTLMLEEIIKFADNRELK